MTDFTNEKDWRGACGILWVEEESATLFRVRRGVAEEITVFAQEEAGEARFARWREACAEIPLRILANLPDGDFRVERLPRLSGRERARVVARKSRQFFPGTPYVMAQPLGRGREKNEEIFFSSLPALWLERWVRRAKPCLGIYAAPQLLAANAPETSALLLTLHGAHLRQTLALRGVARFSRLLRLSITAPGAARGQLIVEETERLGAYFRRQNLAAPQPLPIAPLFPRAAEEEILFRERFPRAEVPFLVSEEPTPLWFARQLAARPPRTHYAPADLCRGAALPVQKKLLLSLGALLCAAGLVSGAWFWREGERFAKETARLNAEIAALEQTARETATDFSAQNADRLRDWLRLLPDPGSEASLARMIVVLHRFSALCDRFPELELTALEWETASQSLMISGALTPETAEETFARAYVRAAQREGWKAEILEAEKEGAVRFRLAAAPNEASFAKQRGAE
ncbi:MAG: hypothetical protein LBG69_03670 [Zoogloeaceae bacterium]|nr:hypothetical protein [Zoogloeaceae bacterium]